MRIRTTYCPATLTKPSRISVRDLSDPAHVRTMFEHMTGHADTHLAAVTLWLTQRGISATPKPIGEWARGYTFEIQTTEETA